MRLQPRAAIRISEAATLAGCGLQYGRVSFLFSTVSRQWTTSAQIEVARRKSSTPAATWLRFKRPSAAKYCCRADTGAYPFEEGTPDGREHAACDVDHVSALASVKVKANTVCLTQTYLLNDCYIQSALKAHKANL